MNTFQRKPDERGSAILMVLGLLSLLLILALVFAVTSRNAQISAEASADQVQAKQVSQSAFNRAMECVFFFQNKGNLLKNGNLQDMMPENVDLNQSMADPATVDTELFYGESGVSDTTDFLGLQPYVGYVDATADWSLLCRYGEFSTDNHDTRPFALQPDGNPYQAIYYSHRANDDEVAREGENSLYEIVAATTLGTGYRTASDDNDDLTDDTDQFATLLKSDSDSQLQFVEDTDSDGHIAQRLGFIAFVDGPKFDVNQLISSKMTGDADEPFVPWVDSGELALGDPTGGLSDYNPFGTFGDSVYAVMGYEYDADGIPDSLYDGGKLTEEETVQYGIHPQELQTRWDGSGDAIYAKDAYLKRKEEQTPPRWFTLDQLLAHDEEEVRDAFAQDLFTLSLASGTKEREFRFNGNFVDLQEMEDTLSWNDTTHYAAGQEHYLMKANLAYPWGLYCEGSSCPFGSKPDWDDIGIYLQGRNTEGDLQTAAEHFFQEHLGLHYDPANSDYFLFREGTTDLTPQVLANMADASDADYEAVYMATYGAAGTKLEFNSPTFQQQPSTTATPSSDDIQEPTVCGNERVPSIVGVNVAVQAAGGTSRIRAVSKLGQFKARKISIPFFGEIEIIPARTEEVYQMSTTSGTWTFQPKVTLTLQNLLNEDLTKTNQRYRVIVQGRITPMILGKQARKNNSILGMLKTYHNMLFIPNGAGGFTSVDTNDLLSLGDLLDSTSTDYGITPGDEKRAVFDEILDRSFRFSIDKTVTESRTSFQGMEYQTLEVAADELELNIPAQSFSSDFNLGSYDPDTTYTFCYYTGSAYAVSIEKIVVMSQNEETTVNTGPISDLAYAIASSATEPGWNLVFGKTGTEDFSSGEIPFNYFIGAAPLEGIACRDPRLNHRAAQWEWLGGKNNSSLAGTGMQWYAYADDALNNVQAVAGLGNAYVTLDAAGNEWRHVNFAEDVAWSAMEGALKNDDPTTQKDWEPGFEPATSATSGIYNATDGYASGGVMGTTFSTAYCPNAPFTSLWQLGAIHRGVEGQTLNLKRFGTDGSNAISHLYEDGDAWFLDYVNLAELDETHGIRGKFNPNCFNVGAYKFLFANIPANPDAKDTWIYLPGNYDPAADVTRNEYFRDFVGGTAPAGRPDEDWETTTFSFQDFSTADYKDVCALQSWSPIQSFFNFVDVNGGGGANVQCNDRQAEALVGCTAGLLSTRYETYTVIAVGQSVQWLMEDDKMPPAGDARDAFLKQLANPIQLHDGDWYSILSTQVRLVTLVRDCWFGKIQVLKSQLL
ncbi:MAG: hypothetical protein ACI4SG_07785 [Oligosphaeraceae bacterium]